MKKILLIEDSQDVREMTAEILALENYLVTTANDGNEGIVKAEEVLPDLIVCDIMMPKLDGYGVFEHLKENPETAGIPFIFLTAKSERADLRKGMTMGADDYLTKPFEADELLEAIDIRLKKNDFLRKEFSKNVEGINAFLQEASEYQKLQDLSADREVLEYERKKEIYSEGDAAHNLYFIQSGAIKTFKYSENGKEYLTGMFKTGDFVGQLSVLGPSGMYTETAVALDECKLCAIPKNEFTHLLFNNKDVSNKFIGMISNDLQHLQDQLMGMAFDTVRKRAATTLLELYDKGLIGDEELAGANVSREDFAGLIGTATETAIRVLSSFKKEGLIRSDSNNKIIVINRNQIQYIADFG
ncbi:response regulator [Maribacter polysiphoniae]|uniref:CRP-like cAMP-binding protein n=1 Tax=Maribacter polysiphoniae TaxID=429344 RepID=A0A316E5Y9_9FLAO|nr:response regulator [Maribacter polysiphoniae]MBD1263151.1 response regulator [Maribacter polysiphoniae]PWK18350.1 CRP-like cAMP-binding protein [Maribacter polysiphoniae]